MNHCSITLQAPDQRVYSTPSAVAVSERSEGGSEELASGSSGRGECATAGAGRERGVVEWLRRRRWEILLGVGGENRNPTHSKSRPII